MSALPPKADIRLDLLKRSASDPKWTLTLYDARDDMQRLCKIIISWAAVEVSRF